MAVNTGCVFCSCPMETTAHLFFQCSFSQQVWEPLVKKILLNKYTVDWKEIMALLGGTDLDKTTKLLIGYVFQNTLHLLWLERNGRRHEDQPTTVEKLVKLIDKNVWNRLSTMKGEDTSIQAWFAARFY